MSKVKQKLVIIDSNALIHRAFHALPPLSTKDGQVVNAVYGFTMILIKVIKDQKPTHVVATFDRKEKTFRHEQYQEYKATRTKQPNELYDQIPLVKDVLKSFNIPIFEKAGYEADDLIGTIASLKSIDRPDVETIIVTGDKDTFQLVDDNTLVLTPGKGMGETILFDEAGVIEKFESLKPKQLIDYKSLRGDPSDNIPGVRGIGHKGAINLLNEFKTLDNIYKNLDSKNISKRNKELLEQYKDDAYLSQNLATIIKDVKIDFDLSDCEFGNFDKTEVIELFQKLNFKRLLTQLSTLDKSLKVKGSQGGLFDDNKKLKNQENKKIKNYLLVKTEKAYKAFYNKFKKQKEFVFDTETTSVNAFEAEFLGVSFCWKKDTAYYLTKEIIEKNKQDLTKIFQSENIKKIGHNIKYDVEILQQNDFIINGIYFDSMIASYLLNPGHRQHGLDNLAFTELGYEMQPIEDLIGKGKDQISMADVEVEKVSWYSCEDADFTWQLYQKLESELKKENMIGLLEKIEMPLVEVLAQIESNGVKIDDKLLKKLSEKLGKKILKIEGDVYKLAGEEFNVASPLQLKKILFEKLKISTDGIGKTKTGTSTAARELDKLQGQHKIIDLIIEFRELSKLKNTYLDSLPKLINKKTGRVHTSFNQTVTATGRLSSSDPNLQNIPIRTKAGKEIRKSFTAEPGYKIIKADYSQIELRIIASLANDKNMLSAFEKKADIHTTTAAFINDIDIKNVTPEIRRQAKEVNFGVLYGMGAWGLAERTGISNARAKEFIDKYFHVYSDVKKYLDETIKLAREHGYVETFYGRRRYIPEINSGIAQVRSSAERMAINMPIQGTAADLIKLAMIEIHANLPKISPKTKMILQVHDELVFEVPEDEISKIAKFVRESMNKVYKLRAPIETEVSVGDNWGETENIKI